MNKIKIAIMSGLYALAVFVPAVALMPAAAYARTNSSPPTSGLSSNTTEAMCNGAGGKWEDGTCRTSDSGASATDTIASTATEIINLLSWAIGIVSVIMIIYGGFRYVISGGDSNGVQSAKNTILFAIVGLIIVALAQIIVKFVIGSLASVTSGS